MADTTNIEALQAAKAQEARQALRVDAVQRCLGILDHQPGDSALAYPGLLHRLIQVLTNEYDHVKEG